MAARDGLRPQIDFPQLIADVIRELNVRGPLGVLNLSDEVRPVFIIGSRSGALQVQAQPIAFPSSAVFFGEAFSPAANTVIVDTGALPPGDYDIFAQISAQMNSVGNGAIPLQHRNAGNTATLATLLSSMSIGTVAALTTVLPFMGYTLALNERLRVVSPPTNALSGAVSATIIAQRRVTP